MVVRDVADLLALNLRHHLAQGVERFLVRDHASSDATPDLLSDFAARGFVEWSRAEEGPFRCEQWMNELAIEATLQGADWILPIDADEFWVAAPGATLAGEIRDAAVAGLEVEVLNFVQQHDQTVSETAALARMRHRVDRNRLARPRRFGSPAEEEAWPFVATAYPSKWISRATPRLRLHRGNHAVDGFEGATAAAAGIVCLHAPLRSRAALATRHADWPPVDPLLKPCESWHTLEWRRRGSSPEAVEAEWRRNSAQGDRLVASGLPLVRDDRLAEVVTPWLDAGEAQPATNGRPPSSVRTATVEKQLREALDAERERRLKEAQRAARAESELHGLGATLAAAHESDRRALEERIARLEADVRVWHEVRSSRFFRLWMSSIRIRRALGLLPAANGDRSPVAAASSDIAAVVAERGYSDPVRIFSRGECARLIDLLRSEPPGTREWAKDGAVASRLLYELAAHPAVVGPVARCLGGDVVLWGAGLAVRGPAAVHPWHTDIESSAPEGGALSVWLGLENVCAESSLHVVPGSHLFGLTIQERAARAGFRRGEASESDVSGWALELDAASGVRVARMTDGEAVFFDGRLWHGTDNRSDRTRTALLLQYGRAGRAMRIPDFSALEWPFRWLDEPRPPCIRVAGAAGGGANRIVAPPPRGSDGGETPLAITARAIDPAASAREGWAPYPLFRGASPNLAAISCHFSALAPGVCPHPPHVHEEEEILLPISGPLEIVEVDAAGATTARVARRGELAWFPSWHRHTVRNPADGDAIYLMFKWTGRPEAPAEPLAAGVRSFADLFAAAPREGEGGFAPRILFEAPTRHLAKLHAHVTTLAPGAGYPPHRDDHDLAFLVLEGVLEACGERLGAGSVLFVPAGELHGAENPGERSTRYLVLEFHGRAPHAVDRTGFEFFELPAG